MRVNTQHVLNKGSRIVQHCKVLHRTNQHCPVFGSIEHSSNFEHLAFISAQLLEHAWVLEI